MILNLGQGNWQRGFPDVIVQLWEANRTAPIQFSGSLPAQAILGTQYQQWRSLYLLLYDQQNPWRLGPGDFNIEIEEDDVTNVSVSEFEQLGKDLQHQLNLWLDASTFRSIDRKLRTHLSPTDEIQVMVAAKDHEVLRFPWQLWQLFDDYPKAELALSPVEYNRSIKDTGQKAIAQVRVLVILGNSQGIEVETDRQLLAGLPGATVTVLAEPSLDTLNHHLWHQQWDILFFAGHSSSQGTGQLLLNQTDSITIGQLKYGLKQAIAHGLQLAIFNSCDGLGLAWDLADLHIPQTIVMREPVPDRVAHAFLKHLLTALANNASLYLAVRSAREKLQSLEQDCPWATQLPVIVQNPAERTLTWAELQDVTTPKESKGSVLSPPNSGVATDVRANVQRPTRLLLLQAQLLYPLMITLMTLVARFLGLLEPFELQALDQLMRFRPAEPPDDRFLIVTIDDADIQNQTLQSRSSLSDEALDQLLVILEQHQARVIGLDIYRDFPVSSDYPNLAKRLSQSDRFIAVCKGRDPIYDPSGVSPPPELTEEFLGFSDFLADADGIIRRHLLSMEPDPAAACTTPYAFSARLVFQYLQHETVDISFDTNDNLVINNVVFPTLQPRSGGYQAIDASGVQILLNYRSVPSPKEIAYQVSLTQILNGEVIPTAINDRIVLIGITANSMNDYWPTPYGVTRIQQTAGVFLHAQMTSHILSAVLDGRPVLRSISPALTVLWVWGWAMVGSAIGLSSRYVQWFMGTQGANAQNIDPPIILLDSAGVGLLAGSAFMLLLYGYWMPLVPAGLALVGSSMTVSFLMKRVSKINGSEGTKRSHYYPPKVDSSL